MVNRNLALALVVIFTITTIGAVLATLYAYQQPLETVETTVVATYTQTGTYSYIAELLPNIIYNVTTLGPDEGKLYEPILSHVNITFNYDFSSSPAPTNQSLTSYVQVEFASQRWNKVLTAEEAMNWLSLNVSELNFSISMNNTAVYEIFKLIDIETGSSASGYNITISPFVFQRATVAGENVYQVANPKLMIRFIQDQGRYIDIAPLSSINQKAITDTVTVRNTWVDSLRLAALAGIIISGIALVASLVLYFRSKPTAVVKSIEKMIEPNKDMIVDTTQVPPMTQSVVETTSLDDLVRTAEVLARPIMHSTIGNEHTFFILDGETKYQYKIIS